MFYLLYFLFIFIFFLFHTILFIFIFISIGLSGFMSKYATIKNLIGLALKQRSPWPDFVNTVTLGPLHFCDYNKYI